MTAAVAEAAPGVLSQGHFGPGSTDSPVLSGLFIAVFVVIIVVVAVKTFRK